MRFQYYKVLMLLLFVFNLKANAEKADTLAVHEKCKLISATGDSILRGTSDSVRIESNKLFTAALDSIVRMPQSFAYSFSLNKNLSVLTSDDDRFRIYTWMLPTKRGMSYEFFGFVQVYNEEKKSVKVYRLNEKQYPANDAAEFLKLADSTWYGALYYKIIHKKYDKKDQYILLGWHGKDMQTTVKLINNISITPSTIEFGKAIFKTGGKAKSRIILEYNARANVSLKYNEDLRMIVYDHLSSSDPRPEAKGMYSTYGPDMSYDGLKFNDGFWMLQKDVQVNNETDTNPGDVKLNHDLRPQKK